MQYGNNHEKLYDGKKKIDEFKKCEEQKDKNDNDDLNKVMVTFVYSKEVHQNYLIGLDEKRVKENEMKQSKTSSTQPIKL